MTKICFLMGFYVFLGCSWIFLVVFLGFGVVFSGLWWFSQGLRWFSEGFWWFSEGFWSSLAASGLCGDTLESHLHSLSVSLPKKVKKLLGFSLFE